LTITMLAVRSLGPLLLDPGSHPRGQPHLSAASGLVRMGDRLYVVADDEHHLAVFDAAARAPGRLLRLIDGDLPADPAGRKARKPDAEALAALPPFAGCPFGALLALGSGSRPQRQSGLLIPLDARGEPQLPPRRLDLAPLYQPLQAALGPLNIEGAFIAGDELVLLQRGNQRGAVHAAARWHWPGLLRWLQGSGTATALPPAAIRRYDLGTVQGVPLGFTDGAALPGGAWVYSAVAEDTADSYLDGACAGAVVGLVAADGGLRARQPLPPHCKVEGLAASVQGAGLELLMVTDADDPAVPSQLLTATWPQAVLQLQAPAA
jgi:hypothetical protein